MRLFAGIKIPPAIGEHLALICGGIPRARWEPPEKFHITLRFMGEVDAGTRSAIDHRLARVHHPAFSVCVAGVGHFPPRGQPRTLWAGVEDSAPLHRLNSRIERACSQAGLPADPRNYHPHITVARLKDSPTKKVIEFLQYHALLRTACFTVDAFQLYSSVLSPRGSKFRIEYEYPLDPI